MRTDDAPPTPEDWAEALSNEPGQAPVLWRPPLPPLKPLSKDRQRDKDARLQVKSLYNTFDDVPRPAKRTIECILDPWS